MTQYVAVIGNPDMGYSIHGPFADDAQAQDWIDDQNIVEHSVCVMELVDAREGYYRDGEEEDDDETGD
jgi:hypothetical protein